MEIPAARGCRLSDGDNQPEVASRCQAIGVPPDAPRIQIEPEIGHLAKEPARWERAGMPIAHIGAVLQQLLFGHGHPE